MRVYPCTVLVQIFCHLHSSRYQYLEGQGPSLSVCSSYIFIIIFEDNCECCSVCASSAAHDDAERDVRWGLNTSHSAVTELLLRVMYIQLYGHVFPISQFPGTRARRAVPVSAACGFMWQLGQTRWHSRRPGDVWDTWVIVMRDCYKAPWQRPDERDGKTAGKSRPAKKSLAEIYDWWRKKCWSNRDSTNLCVSP